MITRIVQLYFNEEYQQEFENKFPEFKQIVLSFEGCKSVVLKKSNDKSCYFTISEWESEDHLNNYRKSKKFELVWKILKANFSHSPKAWTTINVI